MIPAYLTLTYGYPQLLHITISILTVLEHSKSFKIYLLAKSFKRKENLCVNFYHLLLTCIHLGSLNFPLFNRAGVDGVEKNITEEEEK